MNGTSFVHTEAAAPISNVSTTGGSVVVTGKVVVELVVDVLVVVEVGPGKEVVVVVPGIVVCWPGVHGSSSGGH